MHKTGLCILVDICDDFFRILHREFDGFFDIILLYTGYPFTWWRCLWLQLVCHERSLSGKCDRKRKKQFFYFYRINIIFNNKKNHKNWDIKFSEINSLRRRAPRSEGPTLRDPLFILAWSHAHILECSRWGIVYRQSQVSDRAKIQILNCQNLNNIQNPKYKSF